LRVLDLYCGAGGAAMGYHQAGWTDITGVDVEPQSHCPFAFVQGDALEYLRAHGAEFDVIHASPPCQRYSVGAKYRNSHMTHPDSVPPLLSALQQLEEGRPLCIIENVPGAPLPGAIQLCGEMFGLHVIRHRLFLANVPLRQPAHVLPHRGKVKGGDYCSVAGHGGQGRRARHLWAAAMQIDWMTGPEMAQAVPPAYTRYIAEQIAEQQKGASWH